jgi:hypothetical protein
MFKHEEKRKLRVPCAICKIVFATQYQYDYHLTEFPHISKEEYVMGTGCDICRQLVTDPQHETYRKHAVALRLKEKFERGISQESRRFRSTKSANKQ